MIEEIIRAKPAAAKGETAEDTGAQVAEEPAGA